MSQVNGIIAAAGKSHGGKKIKAKIYRGAVGTLITFLAVASATYAWYIYNTSQHTTNVRMAAGAGVNLQISNAYNGVYGSSAVLESFSGQLVPVSTNKISAGFQKVTEFASGYQTKTGLAASIFGNGEQNDYYHTSLFLRTTGGTLDIYIYQILDLRTVMKLHLFLQQFAWD